MRLPDGEHMSHRWRIHEITRDFDLEDVWALPTPGGPDDFPKLIELMATFDPGESGSRIVRALFDVRWKVGGLLGWDDETTTGVGSRVPTLRDRMPDDLAPAAPAPGPENLPFSPLYLLEDEWAAEVANSTMHGVMHLGWVQDDDGSYRGQMAVLVKPNGFAGRAYMAAIAPFRHLIVYPTMMREMGERWQTRRGSEVPRV